MLWTNQIASTILKRFLSLRHNQAYHEEIKLKLLEHHNMQIFLNWDPCTGPNRFGWSKSILGSARIFGNPSPRVFSANKNDADFHRG